MNYYITMSDLIQILTLVCCITSLILSAHSFKRKK